MKALVKYSPGPYNMEIRDVPEPSPGYEQVKVAVHATGICGSDLHIYYDKIGIAMKYPVVIGHEFAGTIVELGEGVKHLKIGDRVLSETTFSSCGQCWSCRHGSDQLCEDRHVIGYWENGVFAPFVVVPAKRIHKLPVSINLDNAPIIEPIAGCYHCVIEVTGIVVNNWVLVTGPGPIGLISALIAKTAGARVVVIGTGDDALRLKISRDLGMERTINLAEEDPVQVVRDLTGPDGVDVFLECSGAEEAVDLGVGLLKREGKYTQIGLFKDRISINMDPIIFKEIKVFGAYAHKWSAWEKAIELYATGKGKWDNLISEVVPFSDWLPAFEKLKQKKALKIIVKPEI
ncbi:MAG TPA: sorbitol dehydrogenase [Spirochaetes bacterium]|nr:sorbitol dehydrogenase [Spirochaetota bacterium]